MKKSAWRLATAAVLFACWIAYLASLALTTTQPIVLSRPQFLSADLYVVADVPANPAATDEPANEVTVKRVVWAAKAADCLRTKIQVKNLTNTLKQHGWDGWQGPGEYILALSRTKEDSNVFQVTPLPRTPGFPGTSGAPGPLYKATPPTLRQLDQLTAEFHPSAHQPQ